MTAVVQRPHARVKLLESECQFYHFSAVPPHGTHLDIVFYFAQKLLDCVDGKVAAFLRARSHHLSSRTAEGSEGLLNCGTGTQPRVPTAFCWKQR
ncbi:uncharacterized protein LOC144242536 isoform X2 [Crocuta crocuta]